MRLVRGGVRVGLRVLGVECVCVLGEDGAETRERVIGVGVGGEDVRGCAPLAGLLGGGLAVDEPVLRSGGLVVVVGDAGGGGGVEDPADVARAEVAEVVGGSRRRGR